MFSVKFIKATKDYCTYEKSVAAPYIRRSFELTSLPEKATLTLTSTGFYKLFLNGTELTASLLAPAITNPDDILFYDTYDLSGLLKVGKNTLAFILGNGMSNAIGGYVWDFDKARFRSSPKLAIAFESDILSFEADTSFKTHPSPIYFDDLRSGEFYNAEFEIDGWNLPDFDDSNWESVIETEAPRGRCEQNNTDRIVITEELKAIEISPCTVFNKEVKNFRKASLELSNSSFYHPDSKENGYVFKFSKNTACLPKLKIRGKKGQRIIIQASDFCSDDNVVSFDNTQTFYPFGFCQRDIYVCQGDDIEEYVPSFTYHGARYFALIGIDEEQISEDTLTMLVINSDLEVRGGFECSDEIANRLQEATRTSDLANFVYFPTDCPHREKNGWTGDASFSAEQFTQNLAVEKSLIQWLKQVCTAQREDGALPGIVPTTGWGFAWGNGPAWDQVLVELPYQTYKYRGETEMFSVTANALFKYLNYVSRKRDKNGLIAIGLGDWNHAMLVGSNHKCALEVSDTATVYNICRKAEILYNAIKLPLQANFCRLFAEELREDFRRTLIDFDTMTVKSECQGAQVIGIAYGLFDDSEIPEAYSRLIEMIHEYDDHFDCGAIGIRNMFRLLANHGNAELAYKMITRTDAPSYGIWTEKFGLVSLAETFNDVYNSEITSHNHHYMGDISGFFISHIAGLQINPSLDNSNFVRIAPNFISTLDYASAFYNTKCGKVQVKWTKTDDKITLELSIPDGIKGEILLSNGWIIDGDTTLKSGNYTIHKID